MSEGETEVPFIIGGRKPLFLTSGRAALALALQQLGIGGGDAVLLPSYRCIAIDNAVRWTAAEPVFYRLKPDLSLDIADIEHKLNSSTRCLIIVHYFGFPQDMRPVRELCERRRIALIEDCAHALFGATDDGPLGTFGDYAIGSIKKFLPTFDGGCLLARGDAVDLSLRNGGWSFQTKAVINVIERSLQYERFGVLTRPVQLPFAIKDACRRALRGRERPAIDTKAPDAVYGGADLDPEWLNVGMSKVSHWITRHVSLSRVVLRRRLHYRHLLDAFADLPGCRPLCHELPAGVVPYVFPLYVDKGNAVFHSLRMQGIQVYRWEDVGGTECVVSSEFRDHLLQLPCHQELTDGELQTLIDAVTAAVKA